MFNHKPLIDPPETLSELSQVTELTAHRVIQFPKTILKTLATKIPWRKKPPVDPQQQRQEKLTEMGTYLQQRRVSQGLSLEAIAKQTCIPLRLLQAIEDGELESLPEPIYIRGFIKQFAEALGLEGIELAHTFPTEVKKKNNSSSRFRIYLPSLHIRPLHLYLFYILLVVISVQGISNVLKQSAADLENKTIPQSPTVQPTPAKKLSPVTKSSSNHSY